MVRVILRFWKLNKRLKKMIQCIIKYDFNYIVKRIVCYLMQADHECILILIYKSNWKLNLNKINTIACYNNTCIPTV